MFSGNVHALPSDVVLSEQTLRRIKYLDFAPHRFESSCKPLCRVVLLFDAIWRSAIVIFVKRAGSVLAQRAQAFLQDSSEETLLQLALLADASLQNMDLIRFYDAVSWLHDQGE